MIPFIVMVAGFAAVVYYLTKKGIVDDLLGKLPVKVPSMTQKSADTSNSAVPAPAGFSGQWFGK